MFLTFFPCLFVLSSCSSDDYLNVIPQNSTAIVSIDTKEWFGNSVTGDKLDYVKKIFHVEDLDECGIDLERKAYVFETVDGNIGLVLKIKDEDHLTDWLDNLSKIGHCKKINKRKNINFSLIGDKWMIGYSSDALLIMGPILPAQQAEMQRQMIRYFEQDEEQSIKFTLLFEKLDSLESPVSLVAQVDALPEKMVAPFTIAAPKGADASQILIAAEIYSKDNECIEILGETFSFNKGIDNALKENMKVFRPIKGTYLKCIPQESALGVFMNVKGNDFINLLHSNKYFQTLLAGINTAIDMDNIIRSVDGDIAFVIPEFSDAGNIPQMMAQLSNKNFLKDVDYWKESCLKGSEITDWKNNSYCYTDGNLKYYFGVSDDLQFYSGNTPEMAINSILSSPKSLQDNICKEVRGKQICFVLNVASIFKENKGENSAFGLLKPLFGNIKTILYTV